MYVWTQKKIASTKDKGPLWFRYSAIIILVQTANNDLTNQMEKDLFYYLNSLYLHKYYGKFMRKYKLFFQNSGATLLSVWQLPVCRQTGPWRRWPQSLYCSFSSFSCNFVHRPWSLLPTQFAHLSALSPRLCPSKRTSCVPERCTG